MLSVTEIFESVQGEGFFTGRPAIFIRFAGCNLCCDFCDTKYSWDPEKAQTMSPEDIMALLLAQKYRSNYVILTGGEPLVQEFEDLRNLIYLLKKSGYVIGIETNGVKQFSKLNLKIDWVTVSPKTAIFNTDGDELKLLYDGTQDLEFYEQFNFKYFYLQPILPERDLRYYTQTGATADQVVEFMRAVYHAVDKCVQAAKEHPKWRVSFQAHKITGVR
jgi:7-carboxy-7-deazaguanine synthase